MKRIRIKWLACCILLTTISLHTSAEIDKTLLTEAESGNANAQIKLALAYKEEKKYQTSHFWLVTAATKGNTEALFLLGEFFESSDSGQYKSLPIAENWYLIGSNNGNKSAELGYERVLETQFNNRRANLVSSITVLDDQIDEDIQQSANSKTDFFNQKQNRISSDIIITSFLLMCVLFYVTVKRLVTHKKTGQKEDLNRQLAHQTKKTRTLQRHLAAAHFQLKKNQDQLQKANVDQSIIIACAVLGYNPNRLPSEKEIKLRYKKLCRVYHPDANGSDEEMKRLNGAVKVISSYLKQTQRS